MERELVNKMNLKMEQEPTEGVNFAVAKSLFERGHGKVSQKSPLLTTPSSGDFNSLENLRHGDHKENLLQNQSQVPSGDGPDRLEHGLSSDMTGRLISTSFDYSIGSPKTNFVIPKRRGDTSDLRWLTAVHNSKPLGISSVSEKLQHDTEQRGSSFSFEDDQHSNSLISRSNSSGILSVHSESTNTKLSQAGANSFSPSLQVRSNNQSDYNLAQTQFKSVKEMPDYSKPGIQEASASINTLPSRTSGTASADHQNKLTKSPFDKSSMKVTLNTDATSQNQVKSSSHEQRLNIKTKEQATLCFSDVLQEIQAKATTRISEQKQGHKTGIKDCTQLRQVDLPQQPPEVLLTPPPPQGPPAALTMKKLSVADDQGEDCFRRVRLKDWNPGCLLQELYQITLQPELDVPAEYINIEGYLEKLPISRTKDTFLKTWKRRYFKANGGVLYYYEVVSEKKESGKFKLDGGKIEDIGERMIGLEDGRGHYLVLRCASDKDYADWKKALQSQILERAQCSWIKPIIQSSKLNAKQKVILLELGSCSVRAGILGEAVALPDVFLPTVVATHRETGQRWFCFDALSPQARASGTISYPIRPSAKVDKYSIDWDSIPGLFEHVFRQLNVDPSPYTIMFSVPTSFSDKIKSQFMDLFVNHFKVVAVNMVCQTILSLYSYNAESGIVVDIGDRIEIIPVADGYVVEGGVTRVPYGGQMITDALNRSFNDQRYRFYTDVEFQIVRFAMEKLCYVSSNFDSEIALFQQHPERFSARLSLDTYNLPPQSFDDISNDLGRFQSPEGLFNTLVWGLDNSPVHEMVRKAIQACPIDMRRQMWRSIYLSGGVTLLRGFPERLQVELSKLAPSGVIVQVQAAPNRYHCSYLGASTLALMPAFGDGCISSSEWLQNGTKMLKKWNGY